MTQQQKIAIELIGANVQTYGHFCDYDVVYRNTEGVSVEADIRSMHLISFLHVVYLYYHDNTLRHESYHENLSESNSFKHFIFKRVNSDSFNVGLDWVRKQKEFKDSPFDYTLP